jgi:hypothetical protein
MTTVGAREGKNEGVNFFCWNLLCKLERQVIGTLYPRGQAKSERASELPSAREFSDAAATAAEASAASAIVQTKQDSSGDEASSTTAHETDERTNEGPRAMN